MLSCSKPPDGRKRGHATQCAKHPRHKPCFSQLTKQPAIVSDRAPLRLGSLQLQLKLADSFSLLLASAANLLLERVHLAG